MISPDTFVLFLKRSGIDFFTGVPDSLLKHFVAELPISTHVIAANEGNAVGLAAGYYLATGRPACLYMQNSGLGNTVNPLLSLADPDVYGIPMVLVIGWRGKPGTKDEPQHKKQGKVTFPLLRTMGIASWVLPKTEKAASNILRNAIREARKRRAPVALIVEEGTFIARKKKKAVTPQGFLREEALSMILSLLGRRDIIVATTGKTSRELFELRKWRKEGHHRDFLTVGSMGHASSIAEGIALAKSRRRVICLDGDGALLMHMGAVARIGTLRSKNIIHILLNNSAHESVGGQPTAGMGIDYPAIARACGYRMVARVGTPNELKKTLAVLLKKQGPIFLEITICKGSRPDLGRPTVSTEENKKTFMRFLS
ncbi:phosphonopyruvate decarboxylase [Candidatus Peregrinibacteria bacterium]|nr:phosphonopyruvate decarboxylase [Candidatus Peregrinibacteria bacterium]